MHSAEQEAGLASRAARFAPALLALVTFALYARAARNGFVAYDDPVYVSENPVVARGLTLEGLRWACGARAGNWHPLTWASHMLDVQLFGLEPGAHHLSSAALHALNAWLVYLALARLTRARGAALFAAAFFALHPLRVESVAWASERKDVLSGTFFALTLLAYERYARRGGLGPYLLVALCLALGLMAKSMLVTLPLLLLLLDWWPLARLGGSARPTAPPSPAPTRPGKRDGPGAGFRLLLEKSPLLALALGVSWVTFRIQRGAGAVGDLKAFTLAERAANALRSCAVYLEQSLWPAELSCIVPHPAAVARKDELLGALYLPAALCALLLAALSLLAWWQRRRRPQLFLGWCWYLGLLLPVVGLVQVGVQAHADRYTYLPGIGLALALGVTLAELAGRSRRARMLVASCAGLWLFALSALTWRQIGVWRDSRTLFEHALAVGERNYVALTYLGQVERRAGDPARARELLERSLEFQPRQLEAMRELALACDQLGDREASRRAWRRVLRNDPESALAHRRLGATLFELGEGEEARAHLEQALRLAPDDPEARALLRRLAGG
jgi:tetratricopeptide (TPR) repeat protein